MKKLALFLLVLVCSISLSVIAETTSHENIESFVRQKIAHISRSQQIPGMAVELYVDGKPYEFYYGYANKEKDIPVTAKTVFELGSISNLMASLLLAQEVDWAKMAFNDPVTKFIPGLPASFKSINLQQLATHTSGLPSNISGMNNQADFLEQMAAVTRIKPDTQWRYSYAGSGLLKLALETQTEKDFNDLYRRHVLNPLKMVSRSNSIDINSAQGYDRNGNILPNAQAELSLPKVKASGSDMQRFLSAAIGLPGTPARIFYPMRMTQVMYIKRGEEYQGLEWQIHPVDQNNGYELISIANYDRMILPVQEVYKQPVYNDNVLADKVGISKGFLTYIAVIPGKKSGIIILANKNVPERDIVIAAREILLKLTHLIA